MTGNSWITAAMAALLLVAAPAWAQDEEGGDGTFTTSDGAAVGVPEPEASGPREQYIAEEHGDWQIRCIRAPEGQLEPCQLYQLLYDGGEVPAAEVNIFDVPDEGPVVAGAQIVTPLDTLLNQPLRIQVDDGQALRYPYTFCQEFGCVVRIGLTEENIQSYRRGSEAIVTIIPLQAPDQSANLVMSLTGFTDAFEALVERSAAE